MAVQKETWKNVSKCQVNVLYTGTKGEVEDEVYPPGRTFLITPEDRLYNQELAANESLDVFSNGLLSPVRLIEGSEGAEAIAANPNMRSQVDLDALFKIKDIGKFAAEIARLTNVTALNRLISVAEEKDATVKQLNVLKNRINEIDPFAMDVEVTEVQSFGAQDAVMTAAPVTPR